MIDYAGTAPGIPELCRIRRNGEESEFYFGVWRSDWPGAGQAYPAIRTAVLGPVGTKTTFITRSIPGWQWVDTFINEGVEQVTVDGRTYKALRLAHERQGIEGNTYHSIITGWRDVETGISLRTVENQIAGQSYGPETTWSAVKVTPLP